MPADVQRAYLVALSRVRQRANPISVSGRVKQYLMPYSEEELEAAQQQACAATEPNFGILSTVRSYLKDFGSR
jgi:pyruvate-formate lyase